jgi:signal transduction histidine kinase
MPTLESNERPLLEELERLRARLAERKKLERLADDLPFGLTIWHAGSNDPGDLRLVYVNAQASIQWATDLAPMVGKTVREAMPATLQAPDAYNMPGMWQRVAESGQGEVMPAVRQSQQGGERNEWVNAHAVPLGDRMVAAVHENITARMHAEQEIRSLNLELERSLSARERRYRGIFNSASVALWETDLSRVQSWLDGLSAQHEDVAQYLRGEPDLVAEAAGWWPVLEVNEAALRLVGARRRQDLPSSFGEVVRGASASGWLDLLVALSHGEITLEIELTFETLEGEKSALVSMSLPSDRADFGNLVVSVLDITERKRLERELWAAQRMESLGHLTGGVAHDFNNLLMVIGSYAGFLFDQFPEGDPGRDDVKVIQDATERAATLTNQLLAFSRRQVQQLEIIDLNEILHELTKTLPLLLGRETTVVTHMGRPLGMVKADRSQLEQVLMNLSVNASEAMPSGGKLTLDTANLDVDSGRGQTKHEDVPPGAYVTLTVTDTGSGMDEPTRLRVFEPFFSTKGLGRGAGLGLSTVYGIVKQSKGFVTVDSEPGHGATFKVYLPRIEESGRTTGGKPGAGSGGASRETVLLVEDEESVRKAARRILERHGYQVLEARQGAEALLLFERHPGPISIVITDVVMPQMNGCELARRLLELRPGIKVLYVSGYSDGSISDASALDTNTAYLQKPFAPDSLLRKLREVLDGPS